jgi:hypothetical protein
LPLSQIFIAYLSDLGRTHRRCHAYPKTQALEPWREIVRLNVPFLVYFYDALSLSINEKGLMAKKLKCFAEVLIYEASLEQ